MYILNSVTGFVQSLINKSDISDIVYNVLDGGRPKLGEDVRLSNLTTFILLVFQPIICAINYSGTMPALLIIYTQLYQRMCNLLQVLCIL